jgi:7-keto-8-aminopelargonate synthetase-like enzyme
MTRLLNSQCVQYVCSLTKPILKTASLLLIMGTHESNPISDSDGLDGDILPNKQTLTPFLSHIRESLEQRSQAGLHRELVVTQPISATQVLRHGVRATNFGSNDYLGLAWHPDVLQAAMDSDVAIRRFGSGASPLVTGHTPTHQRLVEAISRFTDAESAMVFSSGYAANLGVVSAVASKEDVIFSDRLNHASLIDGCRLSGAKIVVYPHNECIHCVA